MLQLVERTPVDTLGFEWFSLIIFQVFGYIFYIIIHIYFFHETLNFTVKIMYTCHYN